MYLMNLMNKKCMTRADLSMMSGVPDSTLRDILSGKAQIDHCEAATIYGIAEALGTSVEDILDHYWDECLGADDMMGIRCCFSIPRWIGWYSCARQWRMPLSRPASTVRPLSISSLPWGSIGRRSLCWALLIT